jgi:hypothetical protein
VPKNFLFLLAFLIAAPCTFIPFANANGVPTATPAADTDYYPPDESILDDPDYDPSHPYYQSIKPRWALGLRAAIHEFPVKGALGTSFQLYGEYMFPFQKFGAFSIGPHIGSFPLYAPDTGIPYPAYENALAGAALRYQLKFMTNQWIVPTMALEWEYYRIKESAGNNNQITGSDFGLSAGVMINLAVIDPLTARDAYQSLGLLRTYFTIELRSANINNPLFSLVGNYWLFGLRLEFE